MNLLKITQITTATDAWCDQNLPADWCDQVDQYLPVWNEKFAELIVRECAEVAADVVCKAEGVEFGLVAACYQYFGVEQ